MQKPWILQGYGTPFQSKIDFLFNSLDSVCTCAVNLGNRFC